MKDWVIIAIALILKAILQVLSVSLALIVFYIFITTIYTLTVASGFCDNIENVFWLVGVITGSVIILVLMAEFIEYGEDKLREKKDESNNRRKPNDKEL